MGIPRFFRALTHILPNIENILYVTHLKNPVVPHCDNLYLDANSIVHNAAQRVFGYGNYSRPLPEMPNVSSETRVFRETCNYISLLVKLANPQKSLHIMLDGVCPRAKQNQQMRRRYRSALERSSDCGFDSNCITPGTQFMERLTQYLHFYIRFRLNRQEWRFTVHLSDSNDPGEGEHKIANHIRKHPEGHHCIYGLDADLIVISTVLPSENIFLLRENVFTHPEKMQFHIFSLPHFRNSLYSIMKHDGVNQVACLQDFMIISFLVGNDFLPCVPQLDEVRETLPALLNIYAENKLHIYRNGSIHIPSLRKLCQEMLPIYRDTLTRNALRAYIYPDETLRDSSALTVASGKWFAEIDFEKWKRNMEIKLLQGCEFNTISKAVEGYASMMNWTAEYYLRGVKDWQMAYNFEYSPSLFTLVKHLRSAQSEFSFRPPCSVHTLLLCVTPPRSQNIIDKELRPHRLSREYMDIVREGTNVEWGGFTCIKPITLQETENLEKIVKKIRPTISRPKKLVFSLGNKVGNNYHNEYGYVNNCRVQVLVEIE